MEACLKYLNASCRLHPPQGSQDTTLSLLFLRSQMKDLKHHLTEVKLGHTMEPFALCMTRIHPNSLG